MKTPTALACFLMAATVLGVAQQPEQDKPAIRQVQPAAWRTDFVSPRIAALRRQMALGQTSTVLFWQDIARTGTPLIESLDGDGSHQLVTFLWRGQPDTRNVLVMLPPFTWFRVEDYLMTRLASSDVWYLSARLPIGARFAYSLSPNDPLDNPALGVLRRTAGRSDPLNPRPWAKNQSQVELAGAPPQPWVERKPEVASGRLAKMQVESRILDNERDVWVYTPPGYKPEAAPYPLLVMLDGDVYVDLIPAAIVLDNLIGAQKIPPTVALLVGTPNPEDRRKELGPGTDFQDFLASELMPWLHAHFTVTNDPRRTIIGGVSIGGFAAAYSALRHPELFGNVLSQSGAFYLSPDLLRQFEERTPSVFSGSPTRHNQEEIEDRAATETAWLAKQFIDSPTLRLRFYMDAGLFETDFSGADIGILESTRHLRDVLLAKGYEVQYQQFVGGHDYLNSRGTLADGLLALVGGR